MMDCKDAIFKVNIYWAKMRNTAIVFRFKDEDNYYAVKYSAED